MGTRHTKERLFEVMLKVNPELKEELKFKEYIDNKQLYESQIFEADNYDDTETEEQISPEEEKRANELDKKAETAVESDEDIQKSVIDQDKKGVDFTVKVPTYKKRLADKNIESLRKMARKLKLPEPQVIEGAVYQKKIAIPCEIPPCDTYLIDIYDLTVKVEGMFKLPGNNKLVAVVDNMTGGSIEIDETEPVPPEYLESSGDCDYCHQERYRGKNFIVKDEDKGKYLRLGSSCVKKYIGINPAKYIRTLDYLRDFTQEMGGLDDDFGGNEGGGGGGHRMSPSNRVVDINRVISILHYYIENEGYTKREWEYPDRAPRYRLNDGEASADKAEKIIDNREDFNNYPIDGQYVKEFKEFASTLDPLPPNIVTDKYDGTEYDKNIGFNEYRAKVKQLIAHPNFRIKDTAFLASAINYFENEKKRSAEAAERKDSQWIGNVNEKVRIPYAKLVDARSGDGQFGTWYLWSFVDDKGNILKKFGTLSEKFVIEQAPEGSEDLFGFSKGDVFAFTAEIKKHDEYKGTKNTQLGRLSKL
jgi:hypothetical protein